MTDEEIIEQIVRKFGFEIEQVKEAMKQEDRIMELMRDPEINRRSAIASILLQDGFRYE